MARAAVKEVEESEEEMEEESMEDDLGSDDDGFTESEDDEAGDDEEDGAVDAEEGDEESDDEEYQQDLAALVAIEAAKMKKEESAKKAGIYDDEGLDHMTQQLSEDKAWIETLATTTRPVEDDDDAGGIADDLKREHNFKALASGAAVASIQRLDSLGVKYRRPLDYYAEMVKTDYHMDKVKDRLIHEKQSIVDAEDRRKQRDAKKFGKQVQHKKELDKAAKKKDEFDKISKWKETQKKAGKGAGDAELDELLDAQEAKKGNKRQREGEGGNRKRDAADSKFGFGGKKRNMKRTTQSGELDHGFEKSNQFKGKGGAKGKGGKGKAGGKAGGKRPGKASRGKGK